MRFGFSSNAFRRYDLINAIKIISDAGYEGIEIMADVPHAYPLHLTTGRLNEIKNALMQENVAVSNVNAFMHHADGNTYHPSWIEEDAALRMKRVDYTKRCIDLARELGAPNISTEPGGLLGPRSRSEGLKLFLEGLHQVEDHARKNGIRILIEPEPGLLIENSMEFLDLISELDSIVFGLNFDIGHFFCVGEDPVRLLPILKSYASHYHLEDIAENKTHYHLMPGDGVIDLPQILDELKAANFPGFVTVELYTYEHSPDKAAVEAFEYLRRWERNK